MTALIMATLVLAAPTARAPKKPVQSADREPPSIVHTPIREADYDKELRFEAEIADASGVFEPLVSWRRQGTKPWQALPLQLIDGDRFLAALPSYQVNADLEYFIESYDSEGNGPARFATPEKPIKVLVKGKPAALIQWPLPPLPVAIAQPPPPPEEPEKPSRPLHVPFGAVITAGTGLALAVVGAVLWTGATSDADALNASNGSGVPLSENDHALATGAALRGQIGSALLITGAVGVAGGVGWFLLPQPRRGFVFSVGARF